jgi:glycosyltransferase involved in cell wall biosynthesis
MDRSSESVSPLVGRRLLMVAHSNSAHTGRWARYFQDTGMMVRVVSPTPDVIDGIDVRLFPPRRSWYHQLKGIHLHIDYRKWKRLLAEFKPDIVHVHYPDGGGRNHFYFKSIRDRLITSTWGSEVTESPEFPLTEKHKSGVRAILAQSAIVTATTRFLADVTAKYCPPGKPIHIIPFGVDCDLFKPAERTDSDPPRPIRLGFFKNLERKYGPEVLLDAFALILNACPGTRLVMAGKGDMAEQLRNRAAQLSIHANIDFPGRLPHEKMMAAMAETDIFVMPSTCQESFGVAAIEASACEVAVVATLVGGVPEAVLNGKTGILVPPFDAKSLADACISLIRNPMLRRQLGQTGRRYVLEHYQWRANAATMASVYAQLLAGGPVTTPNMLACR